MAFASENVGDELLDSINRPFRNLPDLLDALMRALAERTRLLAGSIRISDIGQLTVRRVGGEIATRWRAKEGGGGRAAATGAGGRGLVLPLGYAGAALGEIELQLERRPVSGPELELLRHFARHCSLLVKRYEVRRWSERRLGRSLLLVGMSKALRELESFIEISARGRLPVLLRGEFGTEKAQLAAAIHCCSPAADGPFVQVDCAEPAGGPGAWLEQAEGGTLFLSDVDELEPRLQRQLPRHLPSRLHQWLPEAAARKVRVIASTTADLHERTADGLFARSLLAELDFLSVTIPPLREREGDIEALVCHALERNGYRFEDKGSEELVALCRAHEWPENLFELERMIARLAVMSEGRPIGFGDILRHAPSLALPHPNRPAEGGGQAGAGTDAAENWARRAIDGDGELRGLHEALRRALVHLGAHYDEPISLDRLARQAGVSPSHLGYLFRSSVGFPFKALLSHIRIIKARELLRGDSRPNITQVAMTVGFSDLSHFERSFRRIVGQSPREYRRTAGMH